MAKYLVLYGPTHRVGQEFRFRLPESSDGEQLQRALDEALPGQFVPVTAVLADDVQPFVLRVQPHQYGAWAVVDLPEGPGLPAPLKAAQGRHVDARQAGMALGESLRQLGQGAQSVSQPELDQ